MITDLAQPALDHPLPFPQPDHGHGLSRPPFFDEQLGAWVVSAYDDVDRVLRDAVTFSAENATGPRKRAVVQALVERALEDPRADSVRPFLRTPGSRDGDAHRRERSFFNRPFAPSRVRAYEPAVRLLCEELTDVVINRTDVPFVNEFAVPLTVKVIADALGMPREDYVDLKRWSDGLEGLTTLSPTDEHLDAFVSATVEFTEYITPLIEQRRRDPAEDVISAVAGPNDAGDRLTTNEVLAMLASLLLAGNETTTAALSGTMLYLVRKPDLQTAVRADSSLIPTLVEEGLRLTAPAQALFRTATTDAEVGGAKISKDDLVYVRFAAGNRDGDHFDEPLCPRLDRPDQRHLSFGRGPHVCPGAPLARLELQIAFETLFTRTSSIALSAREHPVVATGGEMTVRVGEMYFDIHS